MEERVGSEKEDAMGDDRDKELEGNFDDSMRTHRAARPMKVVFDRDGNPWICDASVDDSRDLKKQGCWRCGEKAFTRND